MSNFGPSSVNVTDKRGKGTRKSPLVDGKEAPPWWDALTYIDKELRLVDGQSKQEHSDGTGSMFYVGWAKEYAKQNQARANLGKEPVWAKLLLEDVFTALADKKPKALAEHLLDVAVTALQWREDLKSRG